ncbi:MAG TPA: ATP synthase F0 subunit A, partial [Gammaproteobacteria bacterium]|nr:ATP synthase F0 subunit A [Gammaproteobacteria bacterium]
TWLVMLLLLSFSAFIRHKLQQEDNLWRTGAESLFAMMENAVQEVVPNHYKQVTPFIATLWVYLVCANLLGLIPGLHSPTADLSVTAGLAVIVFVSVHWFGIRNLGLKTYLKHYLSPNPIMLPFHLMSEISRTLALAIRLFGNIMSLEMAILLVLLVAGFLVPVPLMMLHLVEALIQAYIFGVLALLYIGTSLENKTTSSEQGSKNT